MSQRPRVLIIGYGNPARADDGLGPAVAAAMEDMVDERITVDADYQLVIEDAEEIARHDLVIFADADVSGPEPFHFTPVVPADVPAFSTHSIKAESVLALADQLYNVKVDGYFLGIRGYDFEMFEEQLTDKAKENLAAAIDFLRKTVREDSYEAAAERLAAPKQPTGDRQ